MSNNNDNNNHEIFQVRSAYCGPCIVRTPEIRLAHSCGSLVNCATNGDQAKHDRLKEFNKSGHFQS